MKKAELHTIYTIGHSTRSLSDFLDILHSANIKTVIDIRSVSGSGKYPHFNKENLMISLEEAGIKYIHLIDLGGRRKVKKDSNNTRWVNTSFRAYADYMETEEFEVGIQKLKDIALNQPTAYMCSEAVWWRCHRSMVSDYLKAKDWSVFHIMGKDKLQEHKFTSPAQITDNKVVYSEELNSNCKQYPSEENN